MPYLLDTDSASLALNGTQRVLSRVQRTPDVWLSGIAAEEITRGLLAVINKSRDKSDMPALYELLARTLKAFCDYNIHSYNEEAARIYASFSPQVKRVGTQDCRIAASAIAAGWIVVTANQKDFSRIPGVRFEDWSR